MSDVETRERLARLEAKVEHLETLIADQGSKVSEMHSLLLQAKGARWAIGALAAGAGLVGGLATKWFPVLFAAPR